MENLRTRTVRFSKVVEQSGRPELLTLWQTPDQDRAFRTALRETRVMTVLREPVGTKKDFGVVGYVKKRNVSFLIFPRTLNAFRERRVVGIKYDLMAESKPLGRPVKVQKAQRGGAGFRMAKGKPDTRGQQFQVTVRCTAVVDLQEQVQAANKREASARAMETIARRSIDFSDANITRKVVKLKKV